MIKIVKPGQKEFKGYCDRCGCEFTYEHEDIVAGTVECPTCGHSYYHPSRGLTPPNTGWPWPHTGEYIPCTSPSDTGLNPCSNCDWWKKMQQPGFTYVGDTPCTWCNKGPYKVVCDTTPISINDNNSNTTSTLQISPEYLKKYNLNIHSGSTNIANPPKSGSSAVKSHNSCSGECNCHGSKNCNYKE